MLHLIKTGLMISMLFFLLFFVESVFASLPQMERGVAKVIGGDPKCNNFLYTNGKSVIIRNIDVSWHPFKKADAANLFKPLALYMQMSCR